MINNEPLPSVSLLMILKSGIAVGEQKKKLQSLLSKDKRLRNSFSKKQTNIFILSYFKALVNTLFGKKLVTLYIFSVFNKNKL